NTINDLLNKSRNESNKLLIHQYVNGLFETYSGFPIFLMQRYIHDHDKPRKSDLQQIEIDRGSVHFRVNKEAFSYTLLPVLEVGEQQHPLKDIKEKLVLLDLFIVLEDKQLVLLNSPKEITALRSFWEYPIIRYTDANKSQIEENLIQGLAS